ncbi:unnamed protein product [Calypogeia fissa]
MSLSTVEETFSGIPFTLLTSDDASPFVPMRAEPKLLNLFPPRDETLVTLNLFPMSGEMSQSTVTPSDETLATLNLFPMSGESTVNLLPQNVLGLDVTFPRYSQLESSISTQQVTPLMSVQPSHDYVMAELVHQPIVSPVSSHTVSSLLPVQPSYDPVMAELVQIASPQVSSKPLTSLMAIQPSYDHDIVELVQVATLVSNNPVTPLIPVQPSGELVASPMRGAPVIVSEQTLQRVQPQRKCKPRSKLSQRPREYNRAIAGPSGTSSAVLNLPSALEAHSDHAALERAYDRALIHYRGVEAKGMNFNVQNYASEIEQLKDMSSETLIAALRQQSAGEGLPMPNYQLAIQP